MFALGILVRVLVNTLQKGLCYSRVMIFSVVWKTDIAIYPGIFRLESKKLNAPNWWAGWEIQINQVGWSTRNMCLEGFIPCCKLPAGGFLGREVNKSCSALQRPHCFDVPQLLPRCCSSSCYPSYPFLCAAWQHRSEEGVRDLTDLWRFAPVKEA